MELKNFDTEEGIAKMHQTNKLRQKISEILDKSCPYYNEEQVVDQIVKLFKEENKKCQHN